MTNADTTGPVDGNQRLLKKILSNSIVRGLFYLLKRLSAILITIVVGVFVTIIIANHPVRVSSMSAVKAGMIDKAIAYSVDIEITGYMWDHFPYGAADPLFVEQYRAEKYEEAGLYLSFWPRHFLWTYRALMLDLGEVFYRLNFKTTAATKDVLLDRLPNTLLLIGFSYLFVFLTAVPIALYLSQRSGSRFDKIISSLTPLSSIPSWVLGVLLVMFFTVELKLLPVSGMTDPFPAATVFARVLSIARHMVLPVTAIFLSIAFQLIYTWKTFLSIYAAEDYVDLGKAKGLPERILNRRYILRPTLPYMVTSFTLSLVGMWQSITALEYFFDWPGIGNLYIQSLPNWLGEGMYLGQMSIVVGVVVLFAYLLGAAVFVLDIVYVFVDPRLRLSGQGQTVRLTFARSKKKRASLTSDLPGETVQKVRIPRPVTKPKFSFDVWFKDWKNWFESMRPAWGELKHSPSAIIGLILVAILLTGSIVTVFALPYEQYGRDWSLSALQDQTTVPKLAMPTWVNAFRKDKYPLTILRDSSAGEATRTFQENTSEMATTTLTYTFDYPYNEFPQDILIYFQIPELQKRPFATFTWITPDGREFIFSNSAIEYDGYQYRVADNLNDHQLVLANEHWMNWFKLGGDYPTPSFYVLFAEPNTDTARALNGTYALKIDILTFDAMTEEDANFINAQLVVLGQVYGPAGTDYLRRDLIVPLLWGMPYALIVGLAGAILTTILSLLVAASAAWLGGWVDGLLQRLIEANIILPMVAIAVLFLAYFQLNMWAVLAVIILLNIFGSPTKAFRAAFLQVKEAPYIESAQTYGASNWRIISKYFIPRILPVMIPQMVTMIPSFVFLEATLAIFGVTDARYPTWGKILYTALRNGATYGSRFWVLEPIALLLLTGLAFVLLGFTLNRILNPRLMVD